MKRWKICENVWLAYLHDAFAQLKSNRADTLEERRAHAIARLDNIIKTEKGQTRVAAIRELARIEGLYAPIQSIVTNLTPDDALPAAVDALLHDPEALQHEMALDAKHLPQASPEAAQEPAEPALIQTPGENTWIPASS
jgi:hypothetical protein